MVQFLSIFFFLGFLQFLLSISKVPVFCVIRYIRRAADLQKHIFYVVLLVLLQKPTKVEILRSHKCKYHPRNHRKSQAILSI